MNENNKEFHFYTDLADIHCCSDLDLETMCTDVHSTLRAMKEEDTFIKTTQICFLRDAWDFIDKGYDVYIHIGSRIIKVVEHMKANDGKDIRRGHDLNKLLLGGVFGNY